MAISIRVGKVLKDDASAYAERLGISFNSLVAVALREYLDRRPGFTPSPAAMASAIAVKNRAERRASARRKAGKSK